MQTVEPDATLVERALAGDGGAFGALLERHRPGLVAVCRRLVADDALAEDCVQDASVLALLRLDRLRSPDQFGWWLRGIGVRTCRRAIHLNAEWRRRVVPASVGARSPGPDDALYVPDGSAGPDEALAFSELSRSLRAAVQELPRGQRAAVERFYLAGLSYQETAAALGIGLGALKVRLHKARLALRARFHVLPAPHEDSESQALRRASKRELAAHEAAHAVLHTQFGGAISRLSIKLDDRDRGVSLQSRSPLGNLGTSASDRLTTLMAGEAANARQRCRFAATFGTSDRAAAAELTADLTGGDPIETALLVDQGLAAARERLADDRTWRLVERVAGALAERQALDGDEFRALLEQG